MMINTVRRGFIPRKKTIGAALLAACLLAPAARPQEASRPPRDERRAAPAGETQTLTAEQKAAVKAILAKYDPAALNAESAKAINEAFRKAGLRRGPGLGQAIKDAGFDPEKIGSLAPPPGGREEGGRPSDRPEEGRPGEKPPRDGRARAAGDRPDEGGAYSIAQSISDRAQRATIAFDALAFLTGDFGGATFLPPGKAADYCGFQYMRDTDKNSLGHNTSFVPRIANAVLAVLTGDQRNRLIALARSQEPVLEDFARKRLPLIRAFDRLRTGDVPTGRTRLDRQAVMAAAAAIFEIDGRLSFERARVLGVVVRSLSAGQKAALARLSFADSSTWPERPDQVDKRSLTPAAHAAVMTYASEMFSWYAGSVEADVYFCPERHATYFGSFYMKDIPAMGNEGYAISTSLTGDSGEAFLSALTTAQARLITELVERQRTDLEEIVRTRRAVSIELRRFLKEETADEDRILALSRRYGELDGAISWLYAESFAEVGRSLTTGQKQALLKLRGPSAPSSVKGIFLFSRPAPLPAIGNTDSFFRLPTAAATAATPAPEPQASASFTLSSPEVAEGGRLPVAYTGDGGGATLPLRWTEPPAGTRSLALVMHHVDPQGKTKWYWILTGIPAEIRGLPRNTKGIGKAGLNSVNGQAGYAPPHSQGPGPKTYVYTLYALSAYPRWPASAEKLDRPALLRAIEGLVLGTAGLNVVYSRPERNSAKESRTPLSKNTKE